MTFRQLSQVIINLQWSPKFPRFPSLSLVPSWDFYSYLCNNYHCCSVAQSYLTLYNPMDCSTPGLLVHHQLLELTQTHVHWVGDAIQPSHPLLPTSPPVFSLSQHQGLFQQVGSLHQMAKYWSFSFNISPSNEHSGLNSFRVDWLDLLIVQGTLKSLLQHHNSKASIPYSIPITTILLGFGVHQAESAAITTHWEIFLHLDAWQMLLYFQGNLWNR